MCFFIFMLIAFSLPFILVGFPDVSHLETRWQPKHYPDAVNVTLIIRVLKTLVIPSTSEWRSDP